VAERIGLIERLCAIRYLIDALDFVDADGAAYTHVPISRVREALGGRYVYLRRQDLERILAERARELGVEMHYDTSLAAIEQREDTVHLRLEDGSEDEPALVIGADGVHSRVRELVFGAEAQFAHFLGLYAMAFHAASAGFPVRDAVLLYEEPDRSAFFYSLDAARMDATYVFRHAEMETHAIDRMATLHACYKDAGWIVQNVLRAHASDVPVYFDSATQIVIPQWHKSRVALIGDACGCLTLIAGQGSHLAMAGGYVLAQELARQRDHRAAFAAYQQFLKPHVERKQRDPARFARLFVRARNSRAWLRRLTINLLFSRALVNLGFAGFGVKSVLRGRA